MLEMAVSRNFIDMAIMINGQVKRLLQDENHIKIRPQIPTKPNNFSLNEV